MTGCCPKTRVELAEITPNPGETWMMQIGRNITDPVDGVLADKKFLLLDRDSKFSLAFRNLLKDAGVEVVRLPYRSPNLNAYAERFVRSIKEECLNRVVVLGESHLFLIVREYIEHYHGERNHQGLDNELLERAPEAVNPGAEIHRRERIDGLLNYYHREVA